MWKLIEIIKWIFFQDSCILDRMGKHYNLHRRRWETDKKYRARILAYIESPIWPCKGPCLWID